MVLIADMKIREGGRHWKAKQLLADFITDGKCIFVDGNVEYDTNGIWQNLVVEAYTVKTSDNDTNLLDAPSFVDCSCKQIEEPEELKLTFNPDDFFNDEGEQIKDISEDDIESMNALQEWYFSTLPHFEPKNTSEFNKSIIILEEETKAYSSDPCYHCKFNTNLDVMFIFDIALWRKGKYVAVIEIVNTSPVKSIKRAYCKKHGITLIEIHWKDVIKSLGCGRFRAKITGGR